MPDINAVRSAILTTLAADLPDTLQPTDIARDGGFPTERKFQVGFVGWTPSPQPSGSGHPRVEGIFVIEYQVSAAYDDAETPALDESAIALGNNIASALGDWLHGNRFGRLDLAPAILGSLTPSLGAAGQLAEISYALDFRVVFELSAPDAPPDQPLLGLYNIPGLERVTAVYARPPGGVPRAVGEVE